MDRHMPYGVAVVGFACRLPGGIDSPDALWSALRTGRQVIAEAPADRFDAASFHDPDVGRPGRSYTFAGGFLTDVAGFDADFFGISPREASRMDPQQRLLLETAVEALEDAGIPLGGVAGTDTAVFTGTVGTAYGELQDRDPESITAYTMAGRSPGNTANRVSHVLDLHGPSMAVDTACSSSLVAVHQACQALRTGTSPLALAGAFNFLLGPHPYIGFSKASMLSPTGRCHTFSADADGYVRAEGGAMVVLKPLDQALRDHDRVHGVILASAVNADGWTNGLSLPNPRAQAALLRQAYDRAGVDPDDVVYLEAHGTGTPAGDPAECAAIGEALGRLRQDGNPLPIGSVKTNLGHLEPASGLAGLCKALLVLRERVIPPDLPTGPPHPAIDFDRWGLLHVRTPQPLPERGRAVIGVNSFGFGGANAHVVLADPPPPPPRETPPNGRPLPVVVTAKTATALAEAARRMSDLLTGRPGHRFHDIAYTACRRRTPHPYRAAVLAESPARAAERLAALAEGTRAPRGATGKAVADGRVVFAFSGNGSVWAGMGADLLREDQVFQRAVAECDALLSPHLGWSVRERLGAPATAAELRRTEIAQPLLFTVQIAATAALRHRGVVPAAVLGHSVGEVAAAHTAGILDLPAAARLIAARSRIQAPTADSGGMAAVGLPEPRAREELARYDGLLELAAVNSEHDVTVSGDGKALGDLERVLTARHTPVTRLPLAYAFHSRRMDPLEAPLVAALDGLGTNPASVAMISTVTGRPVGPDDRLDAHYWWHNIRRPVLWDQAVRVLSDQGHDIFLEVGPHPVLCGYLRRITASSGRPSAVVPTLARDADGPAALDTAVCALLAHGAEHDWSTHFPHPGNVVSLPAYPWQRERHWNGAPEWWTPAKSRGHGSGRAEHPLLGTRISAAEARWETTVDPSVLSWLDDHQVDGITVLPGTAYVEMARAAGRRALGAAAEVHDLEIVHALTLPTATSGPSLLTTVDDEDGLVRVTSRGPADQSARVHARGRARRLLAPPPAPLDIDAVRARTRHTIDGPTLYEHAARHRLTYGPAFRVIEEAHVGDGEVLAAYHHPHPDTGYETHPALLDGALQAGMALLPLDTTTGTRLPALIENVRAWHTPPPRGYVHVRARVLVTRDACWDFTVTGPDGRVAVEARGVWLRRYGGDQSAAHHPCTTVLRAAPHEGAPPPPGRPPHPRHLLTAAEADLARIGMRWRDHPFQASRRAFLTLSAHFTAAAVRELLPDATAFSAADLLAAGVRPQYTRLLDVLLDTAVDRGVLARSQDDRYRPAASPDPARWAQAIARDHPGETTILTLYVTCGQALGDVLRGRRAAPEILFDERQRHLVDQFYDIYPVMRSHAEPVRCLVGALARAWPEGRPLRVLEVGAGSGSLSSMLLPHLPPERAVYTFTDVSTSFFPRARQRLSAYDFVDYRRLDMETDPLEQGFDGASYDLVTASASLHVTSDVRRTLRHLARLLTDDGILLALEPTDTAFLAPCFGLLESFWGYTDTDTRVSSPCWTAGGGRNS
ncbi:beta-ketoacyl synthase N-terminal-like domain-containing protein [Streptomyces sp. CA-181903]|uniref:beta-ketoacyl synthase N-terminal-like domain-containing protein n=1 Tax=Streptomyces sp. CA-181903 TaxID=3240055 RepID=UPI003D902730